MDGASGEMAHIVDEREADEGTGWIELCDFCVLKIVGYTHTHTHSHICAHTHTHTHRDTPAAHPPAHAQVGALKKQMIREHTRAQSIFYVSPKAHDKIWSSHGVRMSSISSLHCRPLGLIRFLGFRICCC